MGPKPRPPSHEKGSPSDGPVIATSPADVAHLLSRAGFGGLPAEIAELQALDWPDLVEHVLDPSRAAPADVGVPTDLDGERRGYWETYVDLVWFWLERCRTSASPLVEKMVLFWHGHLCSSVDKVYRRDLMLDQNQLFRAHGLGSFEELIQQMSVQPAMLIYLDNDQNVAGAPNENFARELMELFTLGVGNYSEADVQAAARAWTGFGLVDESRFNFDPDAHDATDKTFFGATGNWSGPDIVEQIIFGPKQDVVTRFIATKAWSFFAYPNPEPEVVDDIAGAFASSDMDITAMLRAVFNHPGFRSEHARTALVRSPIEFVVWAMRTTGLDCARAHPEWTLEQMGQAPYRPPTVAGWKQNGYWISATALWAKSQFAGNVRWVLADEEDALAWIGDYDAPPTPEAAVDAALDLFGITAPTTNTRDTLIRFVGRQQAAGEHWRARAGLLYLPMLTPEFQLA
ncbi:MAG: DUF1800 family protein [Acidimicrobiales bacterium]